MKKKLASVILAASMASALITGCGGEESTSSATTETDSTAETSSASEAEATSSDDSSEDADSGDVYTIEMQVVTWGDTPSELDQVEEAINKITESEIGVKVRLNPIAAWDLQNESTTALTSGEKVDLICIFTYGQAMDSLSNYTSKNMLMSLNDLVEEYGQDIKNCLGDQINLGYVGDTLYAIPSKFFAGVGSSYWARKDYLDAIGVEADPDKYYTMDDLTEIFQKYIDYAGAGHYAISLYNNSSDIFHNFYEVETLGGDGSSGVIIGAGLDGDTTVVDLFETDEYKEYCEQMHSWYEAGYINPDVNTLSDDVTSQMKSGNYLGYVGTSYPGTIVGMQNNIGVEFEQFNLVEPYASTYESSEALWAIPNSCENPEKVMQFLNLLYQERDLDTDIDSLLSDGLKDVSYTVTEEVDGSKAIITAADGTWSQWMPDSLYGNYFTTPKYEPCEASIYDEMEEFNDSITENGRITSIYGYTFNSENVSSEVAAVASVTEQYRGLVGYGSMDPDEVLPEFISALKDAGIDDIIAENQSQLDEWLSVHQ